MNFSDSKYSHSFAVRHTTSTIIIGSYTCLSQIANFNLSQSHKFGLEQLKSTNVKSSVLRNHLTQYWQFPMFLMGMLKVQSVLVIDSSVFCEVAANTELVNTESLFLGEIEG